MTSIYSTVYGHGQPDEEFSKQIQRESFQRFSTTKTRRSQLQQNDRSFNVASCLVWNDVTNADNEHRNTNNKLKKSLADPSIKPRHSFQSMPSNFLPKLYHSQSMQILKQSSTEDLTAREQTRGATPRPSSSLEHIHTKSMQCLMSKYM